MHFEKEIAITCSILKLEECFRGQNLEKNIFISVNCEETIQVRAKVVKHQTVDMIFVKFWHLKASSSSKIDRVMAILF